MANNFPSFLRTPDGCSFNVYCIGGVKAVETGFILLGTSPDNLLTYIETPALVALAWRNATADVLANHRPNKPLQQIDWANLATAAAPEWAAANVWSDPTMNKHGGAGSEPESEAAVQPRRRTAEGSGS